MAKKQKAQKKNEDKNTELLKNMPPEMQEKMKVLKAKLDKFTKQIIEKFEDYIIGVALLPPEQPKTEEEKKEFDPEKINALVLVDDSDSKKMSKEELHVKISEIISKIAKDIDEKLNPEIMLTSELTEACYDGKEEVLQMIAMAAPVYDPKDMLAAIKISEVHKRMVLKKFEKYIVSYVAAGSLFRGEKSNDIDVYVIIDDTDVKKMSRAELKDKLRAIIIGMGMEASKLTGVKKQFHIQTYILTDFWDNIKDANPVIFTLLRDGVPLYDRGVFMPWKLLLNMGRIKPSPEAIDMGLDVGERLVQRAKQKLLSVLGEDLYYAVLNPAQAALMLYGIPPPTPKETIKLLNDIFVKKEKLLEKKYVDTLENIRTAYKNIEHGKVTKVTGKEIDDLLKGAEDYLKRIKQLFKTIEERTEKESVVDIYETCIRISKDLLAEKGVEKVPKTKLHALFKEKLVEDEKIPEKFLKILKEIEKAKKDFEAGKLSKQEVNKVKKDARLFIKTLVEHLQRKKSMELERTKVRFKYDKKVGELILLEDTAFIIKDIEDRDAMLKAKITKDGGLADIKPSSLEELEKHISKLKITRKAFVKEKLFDDLRTLVGKDVEILIG